MLKANTISLVAKSALVNDEGKILVLTRSATDPKRPGGLDFPGGEVNDGEDILEGARREIREEIGVDVPLQGLQVMYTSADARDGHVILRFLCMAKVSDISITLSYEHSNYEWMTLQEVIERFDTISWANGLRFGLENEIFTNNLQ